MPPPPMDEEAVRQFEIRIRDSFAQPGMQRTETIFLKRGPKVWRTSSLLYFGRSANDISHVELHGRDWSPVDEDESHRHWSCRDDEVEALRDFLHAELGEPGDYSIVSAAGAARALLGHLEAGDLHAGVLAAIAQKITERIDLVSDLGESEGIELLGMALDLRRQRSVAQEFERVVLDPGSREADLQAVLQGNWWMLGGHYVGLVDRRRLTVLDELDIPLLRADGVLHIVELKKACVPGAVRRHRSHCIAGDPVNEAVNQAANYLRSVDEQRATILADLGVDCRRAFATVVIGHPHHNGQADVDEGEFREAIRTFNSHLSRIEILTYEDVLSTAWNMAQALESRVQSESTYVEVEREHEPARPVATRLDDEEPF